MTSLLHQKLKTRFVVVFPTCSPVFPVEGRELPRTFSHGFSFPLLFSSIPSLHPPASTHTHSHTHARAQSHTRTATHRHAAFTRSHSDTVFAHSYPHIYTYSHTRTHVFTHTFTCTHRHTHSQTHTHWHSSFGSPPPCCARSLFSNKAPG